MIKNLVEYTKTAENVCVNIAYSENFKELIKDSEEKLIGTGNPNSEILIIGKEMAIGSSNNDIHQYELEVSNNKINWQANIENTDTVAINAGSYNPLYPYYGQKTIPDHNQNNGTSLTWINYQKLIDAIKGEMKLSPVVNFHEYCFISELSAVTALRSKNVDDEGKRKKSISDRITLWTTDFMRHFPIVIVAAGHYPREYNIDLETLFDASWINIQEQNLDLSEFKPTYVNDGKTLVIQDKNAKNFINVHYNSMTGRILIHTNQFGYTMYNNTLFCIAKIINDLRKR